MGTSGIYNGQKNNNLLPSDFLDEENSNKLEADNKAGEHNENNDNGKIIIPIEQVKWQTVKGNLTRLINKYNSSTLNDRNSSIRHIAKQYVKASGGTEAVIRNAKSGMKAGKALYSLFGNIFQDGTWKTLRDLHIEIEGKTANEVISLLVDELATNAITKEDVVARKATEDALTYIYEYIERNDMDIQCLDKMPRSLSDKALIRFVKSYVWGIMQKDLYSRFEKYGYDTKAVKNIKKEFKDVIESVVDIEFAKNVNVFSSQVSSTIAMFTKKCFAVLEGVE